MSALCSNTSGIISAIAPKADCDQALAISRCESVSSSSSRALAAEPQSNTLPLAGSAIQPTMRPARTIRCPLAVERRPRYVVTEPFSNGIIEPSFTSISLSISIPYGKSNIFITSSLSLAFQHRIQWRVAIWLFYHPFSLKQSNSHLHSI